MLLQFNVTNFKSIANKLSLDLTAAPGRRDHPDFVIEADGIKVLPVAAIFGNNASGKSNLLEAFREFKTKVRHSASSTKQWPIAPFLFSRDYADSPTEFEAFFLHAGKEYQYGFTVSDTSILEEWLFERKASVRGNTIWKRVLQRNGNKIEYTGARELQSLSEYNHLIQPEMLVLSFLGEKQIDQVAVFNTVYSEFNNALVIELNDDSYLRDFSLKIYKNERIKLKCETFIREFDPTFEGMQIVQLKDKEGLDKDHLLTSRAEKLYLFEIESAGTQRVADLFGFLHTAFESGGLLILDELDCCLHPLIMRRIVNMFHDKEENPNHAQLIFTSHNLIVLDKNDLRRDEIWFTEKDDMGRTTAASLAEYRYKGSPLRTDRIYSKDYLAGIFGAIPYRTTEVRGGKR